MWRARRLTIATYFGASVRACALLAVCLLLGATGAGGQALTLELSAPSELRVGERALLAVTLELPAGAASPLLLTQTAEGEALEVVRGRLMRADARDPEATPLRFDLPVVARAPGTSIVRVHALAYVCAPACRAVEAEARVSVAVLVP
jgi:hypothetical protein